MALRPGSSHSSATRQNAPVARCVRAMPAELRSNALYVGQECRRRSPPECIAAIAVFAYTGTSIPPATSATECSEKCRRRYCGSASMRSRPEWASGGTITAMAAMLPETSVWRSKQISPKFQTAPPTEVSLASLAIKSLAHSSVDMR
jgi:hypothetical protein